MLQTVITRVALRIGLMTGCLASSATAPADTMPSKSRKAAAEFALKDAKGVPVELSDYRGKVVLLNFWTKSCNECQLEIPWFVEYQDRYKGDGLAVLGVSMDGDWKAVETWIRNKKVNYTMVLGSQELGKGYALGPIPMSVLIDRDGKIADSPSGVVEKESFNKQIRLLLQEKDRCDTK